MAAKLAFLWVPSTSYKLGFVGILAEIESGLFGSLLAILLVVYGVCTREK